MKEISNTFQSLLTSYFKEKWEVSIETFDFQHTKKEFEGDVTLVLFPLLKVLRKSPQVVGEEIGNFLLNESEIVESYNTVQGYLNLKLKSTYYIKELESIVSTLNFGHSSVDEESDTFMVEYSSPNTNKPLHLGHIRNNLLGYSISKILEANGKKVVKTQIINDRGIHICKSMLAWQKFGTNETPTSSKIKGDHLVGKYYVLFDKKYKEQIVELIGGGMTEEEAKKNAPLLLESQEMLRQWESGNAEIRALWKKMNSWVYDGFRTTYKNLGVAFDSFYYESDTYLLGKKIIDKGLDEGVFYKEKDGSVWIDLEEEGYDKKILLRADQTAVYMTQDLGTAFQRIQDVPALKGMIYTVGNEQDYHFNVLFAILKKLKYSWADHLYHLSYGMVDLPFGKMKSREGTVIDADDLMVEMKQTAEELSKEHGKVDLLSDNEKSELYEKIGLGALKYFILKVEPKKSILFDPNKSIDFSGNTASFIQYTYARMQSILAHIEEPPSLEPDTPMETKEREIVKHLLKYPSVIEQAGLTYNPALIANYSYDLVKLFNSFYQSYSILNSENRKVTNLRIVITQEVSKVLKLATSLLGIDLPSKM